MEAIQEQPHGIAAWRKRMDHAALVLNRATDVFHAECSWDIGGPSQPHPTHVLLAAAALAMEMEAQGVNPCFDSFGWGIDSGCCNEMSALQEAVTAAEWQQIDDLARRMLAAKRLALFVALAIKTAEHPLADLIAAELPEPWQHVAGGEIQELARIAAPSGWEVA